jgi:hypothetical protein
VKLDPYLMCVHSFRISLKARDLWGSSRARIGFVIPRPNSQLTLFKHVPEFSADRIRMRCLACQGNSNLYDSLAGKEGLQIRRRDKPNCFAVRAWVNLQMHHRFL